MSAMTLTSSAVSTVPKKRFNPKHALVLAKRNVIKLI